MEATMTNDLMITFETLTPLWTGGVDGTMDRVHETGIIGSLRWWYEAIVRGLKGQACDPTTNPCIYDESKPHNGLCLGCHLFGATGWRRRFRMLVTDRTASSGPNGALQPTGNRYKRDGKARPSWYFKGGRTGRLELRFVPTTSDFDPILLHGTVKLITRWGGLAAKPQLGYGLTEIVSQSVSFEPSRFVTAISELAALQPAGSPTTLPSLDRMFFAEIDTPDRGVTATLNMKYDVRAAFRQAFGNNQRLRHWVCGYVRGNERQASKISYSQAVGGGVRIWGWIPDNVPVSGVTRDQVIEQIRNTLSAYGTVSQWREFDSHRDTTGRETDFMTFLASLLEDRP